MKHWAYARGLSLPFMRTSRRNLITCAADNGAAGQISHRLISLWTVANPSLQKKERSIWRWVSSEWFTSHSAHAHTQPTARPAVPAAVRHEADRSSSHRPSSMKYVWESETWIQTYSRRFCTVVHFKISQVLSVPRQIQMRTRKP